MDFYRAVLSDFLFLFFKKNWEMNIISLFFDYGYRKNSLIYFKLKNESESIGGEEND